MTPFPAPAAQHSSPSDLAGCESVGSGNSSFWAPQSSLLRGAVTSSSKPVPSLTLSASAARRRARFACYDRTQAVAGPRVARRETVLSLSSSLASGDHHFWRAQRISCSVFGSFRPWIFHALCGHPCRVLALRALASCALLRAAAVLCSLSSLSSGFASLCVVALYGLTGGIGVFSCARAPTVL